VRPPPHLRAVGGKPPESAPAPPITLKKRVQIDLDETDLPEQVDMAIEALAGAELFQREARLVDVTKTAVIDHAGIARPDGYPRIRWAPTARIKELLIETCSFVKLVDGKSIPVAPPPEIVRTLAARGQWAHVKILSGITEWPMLRADGTVLARAGYDVASSMIYEPRIFVQVPTEPTKDDAASALADLLEMVGDFPFAADGHKAAWLAGFLTLLARPAINGPTPLILIDANARGSGKTLLADLYGAMTMGKPLPRRTAPDNGEEWRKSLTSIAIAADPVILIDNVTKMLRSDSLDAVLTGTTYRDRLLSKNEEVVLDVKTLFVCTSNNAMISADLVRRSLHVRLDSPLERPEQRTKFRHQNLLAFATENRARFIRAGLTILRGYIVAGRPVVKLRPMGSYEAWTSVVRAALIWAGAADAAETQDGLRDEAEPEHEELGALLGAWASAYGEKAVSVARVMSDIKNDRDPLGTGPFSNLRDAVMTVCGCPVDKLPTATMLGNKLRIFRNVVVEGRLLSPGAKSEVGREWRVRRV
jgi:hypothetical protein